LALNLDMVGKKIGPIPFTYNEDTIILYALGIGAGVEELNFIYEKNLKVFPTFAVIQFAPTLLSIFVPEAKLNLHSVLHGEHKIILYKGIPTSGTFYTTVICDSIYDKGAKGAAVNVCFETRDENNETLFENRAVIIDRSAGNFGGDRGPKTEPISIPERKTPDFHLEYSTSPVQAALYRLSGDKNLMHIDPDFANRSGFNRPILQGLCTFGIAGRAILHSVCESDPARFKSLSARFMNVVYPGEILITRGWKVDIGNYVIQTMTQHGRVVLGNALAEVAL